MADQLNQHPTSRNTLNHQPLFKHNTTNLTQRTAYSSSNPSKIKRHLIRINHKKLPQDFFNFGTPKISYQKIIQKQIVTLRHKNNIDQYKDKNRIKYIQLPNFGDQIMFGDESVIITDEADIKKLRNRSAKGLLKSHEECNSPLVSFRTIGTMTPTPCLSNQPPLHDTKVFEWTFSKGMYPYICPPKRMKESDQLFRRGKSLNQKGLCQGLSIQDCEKKDDYFLTKKVSKLCIEGNCGKIETQFPLIHRKRV